MSKLDHGGKGLKFSRWSFSNDKPCLTTKPSPFLYFVLFVSGEPLDQSDFHKLQMYILFGPKEFGEKFKCHIYEARPKYAQNKGENMCNHINGSGKLIHFPSPMHFCLKNDGNFDQKEILII